VAAPAGALLAATVRALQQRLCDIYALEAHVDASDFVVDDAGRADLRARFGHAVDVGREALLLREVPPPPPPDVGEPELWLALLLEDALATAQPHDDAALDPWCAALEGVSHLVYVVDRAQTGRSVSMLELELQAEVDKFVGVWSSRREAGQRADPDAIWRRLFSGFRIEAADADAVARYATASAFAGRYCRYLSARFMGERGLSGLWPELRRFWRMGCAEKLGHIEARAA